MSEFCLDEKLKKWFLKWNRRVVTGRCLIELKSMNKEFIKLLKKPIILELDEAKKHNTSAGQAMQIVLNQILKNITKQAGKELKDE